ncbi:unnamed protein product [Echinostoma caproni]|uniref:Uncharacterized protein n=1 Tax=Echinostoma caproni TaxID=27848 RepID=A0A183AZW5_9TREM|nr:unnamed protein product [Echinostoma caproni]
MPLSALSGSNPEQSMAVIVIKAKEMELALGHLDQHKAAGPTGLHPAILRSLAGSVHWLKFPIDPLPQRRYRSTGPQQKCCQSIMIDQDQLLLTTDQ